jgi:hypothetical protein
MTFDAVPPPKETSEKPPPSSSSSSSAAKAAAPTTIRRTLQGGWALPSKNNPLQCKFFHYCRDTDSFKQKLAIGHADVKELLGKLFD